MFDGLIVGNMARAVADVAKEEDIAELRLRIGRPLLVCALSPRRIKARAVMAGAPYVVSRADIDGILLRATGMSLYSVSDELKMGYIPAKRIRVGIGGEGVCEDGKLLGIKNISYLVIRVPHGVEGRAGEVFDGAFGGGADIKSALIIGPPCSGKTTMLRELARRVSAFKNAVIIDERFEIAGVFKGEPSFDIGDCEVISGVKKRVAYENCIRAMSPEAIVTDELFGKEDVMAICDVTRAGVKALASVHGDGVRAIEKSEQLSPLLKSFELAVVLRREPIGEIAQIVQL